MSAIDHWRLGAQSVLNIVSFHAEDDPASIDPGLREQLIQFCFQHVLPVPTSLLGVESCHENLETDTAPTAKSGGVTESAIVAVNARLLDEIIKALQTLQEGSKPL